MADETTVLMFIPGIKGSSTLVGLDPGEDGSHEEWIPVTSCSFGITRRSTSSDAKEEGDAQGTHPTSVEAIEVERSADRTSADLLTWLASKEERERRKDKVLIDYCTASGRYFLRYELERVEIVSSKMGFRAPDDLSETITLTYRRITIKNRPIGLDGQVQVGREQKAEYTVYKEE